MLVAGFACEHLIPLDFNPNIFYVMKRKVEHLERDLHEIGEHVSSEHSHLLSQQLDMSTRTLAFWQTYLFLLNPCFIQKKHTT